jgi:ribosomal protein S18 acetylase RimI-like enzyme
MYAFLGPGGSLNNTVRPRAKSMIQNTVLNSYFNKKWDKRNRDMNYSAWNENGKFAGFALIKKRSSSWKIELIGVDPRKGIGSQLLKQIVSDAKNKGVQFITLESVSTAVPFYEKKGFKKTKGFSMKLNVQNFKE